jgi:hypothetical protein
MAASSCNIDLQACRIETVNFLVGMTETLSISICRAMEKPIGSQRICPMKLKNVFGMRTCAWMAMLGTLFGLVLAPVIHAQEPSTNSSPVSSAPAAPPAESVTQMLNESYQAMAKGELDAALDKVNGVFKLDSQNKNAHLLRASIYAQQKQWENADFDYEVALVLDPQDATVKFNRAELKFMQKKYDEARPGFVQVQSDKDLGDFATYKVFLCDLLGAHEDVAAKELDALNQGEENPSCYFGNAAWDLVHNKTDDAANWLRSAARIYADTPQLLVRYVTCLKNLGYLPLHLSSTK